jgi:hypothetical protein
LWRLRRATAIESGLFRIQAKHLLQFRRRRQAHQDRQKIINELYGTADASGDDLELDQTDVARGIDAHAPSPDALANQWKNSSPASRIELMTRSETRGPGLELPVFRGPRAKIFRWRNLFRSCFPTRASPAADAVCIRRQVTDRPCLVPFEGFRRSRQPATVSLIRLGLALLHLSGHRSVI